jgi:2'-5' RNA ligase
MGVNRGSNTTKSERKRPLCFIALVPPAPVYDEVAQLKLYVKEQYHSKASLNSPPHITLHMPFEWKEEKQLILVDALSSFAMKYSPFTIELNNFGCFESKVIYIDVAENNQLKNLQRDLRKFCKEELNLYNSNYRDHPYHPHITIAFRDLKKKEFAKAWEEFKGREFNWEFLVDRMILLKHDGKIWNIFTEMPFGPN